MNKYDIIVVGSGIVGATAALALAKHTPLKIALLDAKPVTSSWQASTYDSRVSAISLASQRIFQRLNVWPAMLAKRTTPYQKMHVWDANSAAEINFDCHSLHTEELGFIIEDSVTRSSLVESFSHYPNLHIHASLQLISLQEQADHIILTNADNDVFQAKLVIAADGANSWVRTQAQMELDMSDYAHEAIIATVQTTLPHQHTAWQRFLATGPLAFLPLQDEHTSSIVWSTSPSEAARLLALDDTDFRQELTTAFAGKLGTVTATSRRQSFDLQKRHAKNYVKPRLALIGDAAHTIHPMVGQGVNMGLLDAACLVDVIVTAVAKQRDYASVATLRRFERWCKGDNAVLLLFVEGIKNVFANQAKPVQSIRQFSLRMANNVQGLKRFFANYAIGNRGDMPTLASCHINAKIV